MPIQKNAVLPLVVAGGLVAAVAVAVAGGDDDPASPEAAEAAPGEDAEDDGAEIPARHKSILCRKLRCTVEQDEPVFQLIVEHREEAKLRAKEIKAARRKLVDLYGADEIDEEAMREVYAEIADAEGKVELDAYESIVTLHSLLSPEQRATLGRMLARVPPAEVLAKPGGDKGRRDKGRSGRRDAAFAGDREARAVRAKAARERRAASQRGGGAPGKLDPAAARRRAAAAADDGGLK